MENKDIENIFLNGASKFNSKKYIEAIYIFNKAIEKNESYCEAYYGRGRSKYELKRYNEALEDFKKAEELGYEELELKEWIKKVENEISPK